MRTLRLLLPMLIGMTCQAAAQTTLDTTVARAPTARDGDRVGNERRPAPDGSIARRPADGQACGLWVDGCLYNDRQRILLFLGLMKATGRLPMVR